MPINKVERLEKEVQDLSAGELARFRGSFLEFDWEALERELENDVKAGKLDALAGTALREHASGNTKPL